MQIQSGWETFLAHGDADARASERIAAHAPSSQLLVRVGRGFRLLTLLSAGDHVIAQRSMYGGTLGMLRILAKRFGVNVTFVGQTTVSSFEAAATERTKLVMLKSPSNPLLALTVVQRADGAGTGYCGSSGWADSPCGRARGSKSINDLVWRSRRPLSPSKWNRMLLSLHRRGPAVPGRQAAARSANPCRGVAVLNVNDQFHASGSPDRKHVPIDGCDHAGGRSRDRARPYRDVDARHAPVGTEFRSSSRDNHCPP